MKNLGPLSTTHHKLFGLQVKIKLIGICLSQSS